MLNNLRFEKLHSPRACPARGKSGAKTKRARDSRGLSLLPRNQKLEGLDAVQEGGRAGIREVGVPHSLTPSRTHSPKTVGGLFSVLRVIYAPRSESRRVKYRDVLMGGWVWDWRKVPRAPTPGSGNPRNGYCHTILLYIELRPIEGRVGRLTTILKRLKKKNKSLNFINPKSKLIFICSFSDIFVVICF